VNADASSVAILLSVLSASAIALVHATFAEWAFHRFWLHRPWLPEGCFTSHTLVHHQLCKYDDTFHVEEEEQHEALTFEWWGGPTLIAINMIPWVLAAWGFHAAEIALPYVAVLISAAAVFMLYYVGYEGFHFLMHKPTIPLIENSRPFQFLKRHHRIHHMRMNRNLNVLFPLADLLLGTLVTEMPVKPVTPGRAREVARKHSKRASGREEVPPSSRAPEPK
jgi:hypothetical protein